MSSLATEGVSLRPKALPILREGRVSVVRATCDEQQHPVRVMAMVKSSRPERGRYVVDGERLNTDAPLWNCTCHAGMRYQPCPHKAAVQLITVGAIQ
jgi:hypothetical protein